MRKVPPITPSKTFKQIPNTDNRKDLNMKDLLKLLENDSRLSSEKLALMLDKEEGDIKRMIEDCEAGKIDVVLCKSLSRFSRNTLDGVTYIRHLQGLGVRLIFENQQIKTMPVNQTDRN